MPEAFGTALTIAAIGLPVMFTVIGLFVLLAKVLLVLFPNQADAAAKDN
jgi:hypothetical protein